MVYFNPLSSSLFTEGKPTLLPALFLLVLCLCGWVLRWREGEVHLGRGAGNTSLLGMPQATFRTSREITHGGTHLQS